MCKTYKFYWQLCNLTEFCLLIRFTKAKCSFFYPEIFILFHSTALSILSGVYIMSVSIVFALDNIQIDYDT